MQQAHKDLQILKLKTELTRKSFQYSAVKDWNDIPGDIREASGLNNFKKQLKVHLKSMTRHDPLEEL